VGRARERGRAGLLAETLDGGGAEGVRRELKPPATSRSTMPEAAASNAS
jgi:hypothetical protein